MKRSHSSTGKHSAGKQVVGKRGAGKKGVVKKGAGKQVVGKRGAGKQGDGKPGKDRTERSRRGSSAGTPSKRRSTMGTVSYGKSPPAPLKGKSRANQTKSSRPGERLQKVLAASGVASRRECEQLMLEGRVEVDGQVVKELGTKVDPTRQDIRVDGESLARPKRVYYAVHKPTGVVCTARDPSGRPRVIDMLPVSEGRVFNVGRLDIHSEGLILVTNDGALADQLTHPRYGIEKTYEVYVQGHPDRDVLNKIRKGMHLAEGFAQVVSVRIKKRLKNTTALEMVLDEGRNREVRRLFARVGHKVQRLVRIAIGPIRLGDMPRGAIRQLSPQEVDKLRNAAVKESGREERGAKKEERGVRIEERGKKGRGAKKVGRGAKIEERGKKGRGAIKEGRGARVEGRVKKGRGARRK
jgi:23S rRNA pseudouridine2605 synthase